LVEDLARVEYALARPDAARLIDGDVHCYLSCS
jgi:hypothetical protein